METWTLKFKQVTYIFTQHSHNFTLGNTHMHTYTITPLYVPLTLASMHVFLTSLISYQVT